MSETVVPADERPTALTEVEKAREARRQRRLNGAARRAELGNRLGSYADLAAALRELGCQITSQAISQWEQVPAERVLLVEQVTGIPRHELRPDIYPAPAAGAAS